MMEEHFASLAVRPSQMKLGGRFSKLVHQGSRIKRVD